jgi:hypothetical protein
MIWVEIILLLVESPLGVSPAIDPVSLVESHLWSTKQGIVDRLNSQHELIGQPVIVSCNNRLTE